MQTTTITDLTITEVARRKRSLNGNARFRLFFGDQHASLSTESDSSLADTVKFWGGISGERLAGSTVDVVINGRGSLVSIDVHCHTWGCERPAQGEHAADYRWRDRCFECADEIVWEQTCDSCGTDKHTRVEQRPGNAWHVCGKCRREWL